MLIQNQSRPPTPNERAELEDHVADRAADIARFAETIGHPDQADVFWHLAHRCRASAMMLRVQNALAARGTLVHEVRVSSFSGQTRPAD